MAGKMLRICIAVLSILGFFFLPLADLQPARAQTITYLTWIGPINGKWSNSSNWSPNLVPQNDYGLLFSGTGVTSNNDMDDLRLYGIGITASGTMIQGKKVTITHGVGNTSTLQPVSATIALPLTLAGPVTIDVGYLSSSLTFSGIIDGTGEINKSGPGSVTLSGDNTFSGGVTVNAGVVVLAGNNTFSGGVTVNAGKVTLNHPNGAGSGPVQVLHGSILELNSGATPFATPISLSGTGAKQGSLQINPASAYSTYTVNSPISLTGTDRINASGGYINLNGALSSSSPITVTMDGGVEFYLGGSSPNTFSGKLNLAEGTLHLRKPAGVVAIPDKLSLSAGSNTQPVIVRAEQNNQFDPGAVIYLDNYTHLDLNGTSQTVRGIKNFNLEGCQISLDNAERSGQLTFQTQRSDIFYLSCDVSGLGGLTVTGEGNQTFFANSTPFRGPLDVLNSCGYLDGFRTTGPYHIQGGYGSLEYGSSTGSTLMEAGQLYVRRTDGYPASSTGSLVMSGASSIYFLKFTSTEPMLIVTGTVNLGGAFLDAYIDTESSLAIGQTQVLIQNQGLSAVQGIFDQIPEGSVGQLSVWTSSDHFPIRIHYAGGDGNDITMTRLARTSLGLTMLPSAPNPGEMVTLQAHLVTSDTTSLLPKEKVKFYDGQQWLANVSMDTNGFANYTIPSIQTGIHRFQARFAGDLAFNDASSPVISVQVGMQQIFLPLLVRP